MTNPGSSLPDRSPLNPALPEAVPTHVAPAGRLATDPRVELLLALGRALHQAGLPSHRLEQSLMAAARATGLKLDVMSLPTGLLLGFHGDQPPASFVLRVQPGRIDLARWTQLAAVADEITAGRVSVGDARRQIDAIMAGGREWGSPARIAAFVLSAGAFAVFFNGGTAELLVALCVGLAVGGVAVAQERMRFAPRLFELLAALAAGMVVNSIVTPLGDFVHWVPIAAGLIILLPGIMLVDAVEELAHGQLVSGSARMSGVGVVFLAMTFGVLVGWKITDPLPSAPGLDETVPLPAGSVALALVAVAIGSTIRFRARPRDFWPILGASALALGAARFGAWAVGPVAGEFLGAFALGLAANVYARYSRRAPELLVIPGLALLVPGSVGVRTMAALVGKDFEQALAAGFDMFLVAMALVAGLLFSNSLARERPSSD
jgi:uncharacterized membrane protein YjjP (DUF1212 family)